MRSRRLWPALAPALLVFFAGCGGDNVRVNGTLQRGGAPLTTAPGDRVVLTFYPTTVAKGADGKPTGIEYYTANVQSDGSFEFPGREGKGIPKGKYRVVVALYSNNVKNRKDREKDQLQGAFNEETSPVYQEVTRPGSLTIDLPKDAPAAAPKKSKLVQPDDAVDRG
jgi:hypothetical protein